MRSDSGKVRGVLPSSGSEGVPDCTAVRSSTAMTLHVCRISCGREPPGKVRVSSVLECSCPNGNATRLCDGVVLLWAGYRCVARVGTWRLIWQNK